MFSIGWGEIGLIIVIVLVIFKPEEWPEIFYKAGIIVKKIQRFIASLKYQTNQILQEREIEEMKKKSYEDVKKLEKKLRKKAPKREKK